MVSIIVPNYNNYKYLYKCLSSIEEQSYNDIEVIVIDDGSDDNSIDLIKEFKEKSKYRYYIIEQFNQNGSVARNRGIEIANGDYLYFLDSDDELFDENVIQTMISEISGYDFLIMNYTVVGENNVKKYDYINREHILKYNGNYKYVDLSPVPSNKLFLSKIVKDNNIYFSNVRIGQDLNFFLKYLSVCDTIKISEKFSYKYRIVDSSVTRRINLNLLDIFIMFEDVKKFYNKKHFDLFYNKFVVNIALKHFHQQFSKTKKIKNRKLKKALFSYFNYCVYKYSSIALNKDSFYKKQIRMFFIKKILIMLNIYDFVLKVGKKNDL